MNNYLEKARELFENPDFNTDSRSRLCKSYIYLKDEYEKAVKEERELIKAKVKELLVEWMNGKCFDIHEAIDQIDEVKE